MGSSSLAGGQAQDAQPQQMTWLVRQEPEEPSWGWETAFMFPNLSCQLRIWCGETEMWITTPAKVDALRRVISGWRFIWHSLAL